MDRLYSSRRWWLLGALAAIGAGCTAGQATSSPDAHGSDAPLVDAPGATDGPLPDAPNSEWQELTIVIAGQSNSNNHQCSTCTPQTFANAARMEHLTPQGFVNVLTAMPTGKAGALYNFVGYGSSAYGGTGGGISFWPSVFEAILQGNQKRVRFVMLGEGSTSVFHWTGTRNDIVVNYMGDLMLRNRFMAVRALPQIDYVFWVQGETDNALLVDKATYKSGLSALKAQAEQIGMSQLARKPKWVIFPTLTNPSPTAPVRLAMQELASERPSEFLLGPDLDFPAGPDYPARGGYTHFDDYPVFHGAVTVIVARLRALGF